MVINADYLTYQVAQTVKNLPAMQETQVMRVWSLVWEDPLEKGTATHSSILAWRIPWTEEPGGLQSMGSQRVGHDWATFTCHAPSTNTLYILYGWKGNVLRELFKLILNENYMSHAEQIRKTRDLKSLLMLIILNWVSQVALVVKKSPASSGDIRDMGLSPGLRRSPGEGHSNPLPYSCLESPMDKGAWRLTVRGITKSWTGLSDYW